MVPVDLLEAELPQTFNLLKKKKKRNMQSTMKWSTKMKYAYIEL